ncbi:MAG: hypothetical protein ACE5RN_08790, partial [Nitrosopumilaceae archaeon]
MALRDSIRVYIIAIFLFTTLLFSSISNTNYESFAISNDHKIDTNSTKNIKKISVDHSISLSESMGLSSGEEKKFFDPISIDNQKTVKSINFEEELTFSSDFSQHESSIILVKQNYDRKGIMERIITNERIRNQDKEYKNYFNNAFELINIDSSSSSNNKENLLLKEYFISNIFEYDPIDIPIYNLELKSFVDSILQLELTNNLFDSDNFNGLIFLALISGIILTRSENNNIKFYSFRKLFSYVFIIILLSSGIISPISISSSYWGNAFAEEIENVTNSTNLETDLLENTVDDLQIELINSKNNITKDSNNTSNPIIYSNDITNSSLFNIEEIIENNLTNSLVENYTVPISN